MLYIAKVSVLYCLSYTYCKNLFHIDRESLSPVLFLSTLYVTYHFQKKVAEDILQACEDQLKETYEGIA